MNFDEYRRKYYRREVADQDWAIEGMRGYSIYVSSYAEALIFYSEIFGEAHYKEKDFTYGWRLGDAWFTLFPSEKGDPLNVEITVYLQSKMEVDRLSQVFLKAGARGKKAEETLMYVPVYVSFLQDPFGLSWSLVHSLSAE
jgi:predicted 3-demethylubiquinone-9 3-methyltransferase (glyoxalase superfamily)